MAEYTFVPDANIPNKGVGTLTFQVQFYRYVEIDEYEWADDVQTQIFFDVYSSLNQDYLANGLTAGKIETECTDEKYLNLFTTIFFATCFLHMLNSIYVSVCQGVREKIINMVEFTLKHLLICGCKNILIARTVQNNIEIWADSLIMRKHLL